MKWYQQLYIGDSVEHKVHKLKWKINHNAGTLTTCILTFPSNENNILDIIPARELLQKGYPKKNLFIVGIAGDREEAFQLAAKIIEECFRATGEFHLKTYLSAKTEQNL